MQPQTKPNAAKEQPKTVSFARRIARRLVKAVVATAANVVVTAALGPVAGEITKIVISGDDDLIL